VGFGSGNGLPRHDGPTRDREWPITPRTGGARVTSLNRSGHGRPTPTPATVKEILGTCVSVGCTVDGKDPKDLQTEIDDGEVEIAA